MFSALERIHRERIAKGGALGGVTNVGAFEEEEIPPLMRRTIAVYEAAKALTGYITPNYDEITKARCWSAAERWLLGPAPCSICSNDCSATCGATTQGRTASQHGRCVLCGSNFFLPEDCVGAKSALQRSGSSWLDACGRTAVQVSACPGGAMTGYTYFIPSEEHLESRVTTRGFMEARMVVALAGRHAPPNHPTQDMLAFCSSPEDRLRVDC